jgi:hypothetical protein
MEINNKLKINEYVSVSQLKRKLKAYLIEQGYSEFKTSVFAQGLIISLVIVLEELISDCLKSVKKDNSGLYTINSLILKNVLYETDKYSFCLKYLRKYNHVIKYHDSVLFNIKKVMDNLEIKHGSKLMIDSESKNMICYMILGLQYDLIELSLKMVKYANRKTLNNLVLEIVCQYLMSDDFSSKIKLKLDSVNLSNNTDEIDDVEEIEESLVIDDVEELDESENTGNVEIKIDNKIIPEEIKQETKQEIKLEEMKLENNKIEIVPDEKDITNNKSTGKKSNKKQTKNKSDA